MADPSPSAATSPAVDSRTAGGLTGAAPIVICGSACCACATEAADKSARAPSAAPCINFDRDVIFFSFLIRG